MAVDLPPGVAPLPPNPPPPLGDADPATRARRIAEHAEQFVDTTAAYIERLWAEYGPWNRWRDGTATALNTASRTVTVDVDPGPGNIPAETLNVGYGRPTWQASRIVGKRVKVMFDLRTRLAWIDVVTSP